MYKLKEHEEKILRKYLQFSTYAYSITNIENNGNYTIVEVQEFDPSYRMENEYSLYIRDGKIENVNGDILTEVYGTYAASTDTTFVMLDFYQDLEVKKAEVVGFCHGNEEDNITELLEYVGKITAEYEM